MTMNGDLQHPRTFETRGGEFAKISELQNMKRRDIEGMLQVEVAFSKLTYFFVLDSTSFISLPVSTTKAESLAIILPVTLSFSTLPAASTSIQEIESMLSPPFRRSLASVDVQNFPALMEPKN